MEKKLILLVLVISSMVPSFCANKRQKGAMVKKEVSTNFVLTADDFKNGQPLGVFHSWKAGNKAPELTWSNPPHDTKSFALIVDDPDAPDQIWVHWVVYNIPASMSRLPETLGRKKSDKASGIKQGINDFKEIGYDGPYPPVGAPHRYYFKLYALNVLLSLDPGATKSALEEAMRGHVIGSAQIMGTYARKA